MFAGSGVVLRDSSFCKRPALTLEEELEMGLLGGASEPLEVLPTAWKEPDWRLDVLFCDIVEILAGDFGLCDFEMRLSAESMRV